MDAVTVACLQMRHGPTLEGNLATADRMLRQAEAAGADVAVLPEYWYLPMAGEVRANGVDPIFEEVRAWTLDRSRGSRMLLAANAPLREGGKTYNAVILAARGATVGVQRKIHPMPLEQTWGVAAATEPQVFEWNGLRVGVLVCADVLHPENARVLALKGARIALNPVLSPYRHPDPWKQAREAMMVARCYDNGFYLAKAGGFGAPKGGEIVGRSLVCGPTGVLARYDDERAEKIVAASLALAELEEFRKRHLALPRRNPAAYAELMRTSVEG
ncbi:MAG TPA: carbon-nitrogen hydrolase family protein [Candidatus Thermoplasmatota archaeon]|nr:carbon-nitrogen hydrolase family protein [Candidatus Thermoplasmatota archaeon]